jgi:ABC-2 type transport system permease protein
MVVVGAFALIDGVEVRATWLLFVLVVVAVVVFATAISVLLSVLFVRYRDVRPIWEVALQLFFWGTPIIYTIESVPENLREALMLNPFAVAVQQSRHWLIDPNAPTAADAIGGTWRLLIPAALFVGVTVFSFWQFRRSEGRLAEDL